MKRIKLLSFFAGVALTLFLGSCANDDIAQQPTGTGDNPTDEATFEAAPAVPTRTTMSNTGAFKWQIGDKIWVKDDTGTWCQSSNAPTSETASFKFKVPGTFTGSNTYTVYYPGKNGNRDKVTISASQSQADPDSPAHVGVSGDCGWATATKEAGAHRFNFTLDHKAAFLVFSPYCNNTVLNSAVQLTKIEVTSDNNLVGTFTLDPTTNQLTGSGSGKQINLTTKGGSATPYGFSVPTSAAPATNASYVVIKPGTHTLKVRFWIKDNTTNVEGTVTKLYPAFTYAANTYYTMPSELNIKDYPGNNYYMWDAQQNYWAGFEWNSLNPQQPTTVVGHNNNYPQNNTDPRWYNEAFPGAGVQNDPTTPLFQSLPNVNELSWYCMKGDPRWDAHELWATMGHLYKGGMWFKKADKIATDNGVTTTYMKTIAVDKSTNLLTNDVIGYTYHPSFTNNSVKTILPTATEQANYFYLPALGLYSAGGLGYIGQYGIYSASNGNPRTTSFSYILHCQSNRVYIAGGFRNYGYSVAPFSNSPSGSGPFFE